MRQDAIFADAAMPRAILWRTAMLRAVSAPSVSSPSTLHRTERNRRVGDHQVHTIGARTEPRVEEVTHGKR